MELACFGKLCITAGTGRYSGLGFTLDSDNQTDYLKTLNQLHLCTKLNNDQLLRAKWHAYAAFDLRLWLMKSIRTEFKYLAKGNFPLDHNLKLISKSLNEIDQNGDLTEFADWAENGNIDFLQEDTLN